MESTPLARARQFVEEVEIPQPRVVRGPAPDLVELSLETGRDQAAIVGSEAISFVRGVTAERRQAIIDSSTLAQLVAKKNVPERERIYDWYESYFDVLANIGWVVQDRSFAEYREQSNSFDAHKAILAVATTLLGAAPTALALVTTTINALHSMNEDSPWIALFNRESQTARTARFQISLVEQEEAGPFFVTLMAFGLEAKATITQVLFFKARANEATLRHHSGRVTINTHVLDGVSDAIRARLVEHSRNFVSGLPDLS